MHCPNCGHANLRTVETFQQPDKTLRTKKCLSCEWKFTSVEEIPDEPVVIPTKVRKPLKKRVSDQPNSGETETGVFKSDTT